jgi:PqqD family protein of HPr-rel-A system
MEADVFWRLHGEESWRSVECDDVRILFQHVAGKTHFLNASSAFILDLLADAPLSFRGISDALSEELGAELTLEQSAQLTNHLRRLEALGLIARSSSLAG